MIRTQSYYFAALFFLISSGMHMHGSEYPFHESKYPLVETMGGYTAHFFIYSGLMIKAIAPIFIPHAPYFILYLFSKSHQLSYTKNPWHLRWLGNRYRLWLGYKYNEYPKDLNYYEIDDYKHLSDRVLDAIPAEALKKNIDDIKNSIRNLPQLMQVLGDEGIKELLNKADYKTLYTNYNEIDENIKRADKEKKQNIVHGILVNGCNYYIRHYNSKQFANQKIPEVDPNLAKELVNMDDTITNLINRKQEYMEANQTTNWWNSERTSNDKMIKTLDEQIDAWQNFDTNLQTKNKALEKENASWIDDLRKEQGKYYKKLDDKTFVSEQINTIKQELEVLKEQLNYPQKGPQPQKINAQLIYNLTQLEEEYKKIKSQNDIKEALKNIQQERQNLEKLELKYTHKLSDLYYNEDIRQQEEKAAVAQTELNKHNSFSIWYKLCHPYAKNNLSHKVNIHKTLSSQLEEDKKLFAKNRIIWEEL